MIRILTDSTADFSMADAAALGVAVVPLTVSFGDAHYQDCLLYTSPSPRD